MLKETRSPREELPAAGQVWGLQSLGVQSSRLELPLRRGRLGAAQHLSNSDKDAPQVPALLLELVKFACEVSHKTLFQHSSQSYIFIFMKQRAIGSWMHRL